MGAGASDTPRPSGATAVSDPMNWVITLALVCCTPVAGSPETCDRPAGVRLPKTVGMPPVRLKKSVRALAALVWFGFRPRLGRGETAGVEDDVVDDESRWRSA